MDGESVHFCLEANTHCLMLNKPEGKEGWKKKKGVLAQLEEYGTT